MKNKNYIQCELKQISDPETGVIEAYAAIFGNVDSYNDVILPGAFAKTLQEWEDSDSTIPLLWGHDLSDPMSNIGGISYATEDDKGLFIRATFDIEDNPRAKQVYKLCKERRVRDLSFAFNPLKYEYGEKDGKNVRFLNEVQLYECSIVGVGANPLTEIVSVKEDAEPEQELSDELDELLDECKGKIKNFFSTALNKLRESAPESQRLPPADSEENEKSNHIQELISRLEKLERK